MTHAHMHAHKHAQKDAHKHALACLAIAQQGSYEALLRYCRHHDVEPPVHAHPASGEERRRLLDWLAPVISDYGWWTKRLKLRAARARRRARMPGVRAR